MTATAYPSSDPELAARLMRNSTMNPTDDTDLGIFDLCFDADMRQQADAIYVGLGSKSIELLARFQPHPCDGSRQRNHAWLEWWQAVRLADEAARRDLVKLHAPPECWRIAHEDEIRTSTACLRTALGEQASPERLAALQQHVITGLQLEAARRRAHPLDTPGSVWDAIAG